MKSIRVFDTTDQSMLIGINFESEYGKRDGKIIFLKESEATGLAEKLIALLDMRKNIRQGTCIQCGESLYPDQLVYEAINGGIVHKWCIHGLLDSGATEIFVGMKPKKL